MATCFQLFGNKWKIYVIQQLEVRPFGFNELRRAIPGISQKVLSSNLKEMEAAGLINREVVPETPVRTEYSLTELGASLMPLIESMVTWGTNYQELVRALGVGLPAGPVACRFVELFWCHDAMLPRT